MTLLGVAVRKARARAQGRREDRRLRDQAWVREQARNDQNKAANIAGKGTGHV